MSGELDLTAAIETADLLFFPAHQEPDELTRARFANAITAAAELIVADTRRQVAEGRGDTFEEWRVTGQPNGTYAPYDFTWSADRGDTDPESSARAFVRLTAAHGWDDGPHLSRRTVTRTEWEAIARGGDSWTEET